MIPHRLAEACALLPVLHLPQQANVGWCVGPHAELLAASLLKWPDLRRVWVDRAPVTLRDQRIQVGIPPAGSCTVLVCSPDTAPTPLLPALMPGGVLSCSTLHPDGFKGLKASVQQALGPSVTPWRDYLPEPVFGLLASVGGKVLRVRQPPRNAQRITAKYLPCLFVFAADEWPLVSSSG